MGAATYSASDDPLAKIQCGRRARLALQTTALFILTHGALRVGYLAATALAVELAVLNNFVWHQRWTWKDRPAATKGETLCRLAKFNVTNGMVSLGGNLVMMSILVGRLGLPIAGANVVSVASCAVFNFIYSRRPDCVSVETTQINTYISSQAEARLSGRACFTSTQPLAKTQPSLTVRLLPGSAKIWAGQEMTRLVY